MGGRPAFHAPAAAQRPARPARALLRAIAGGAALVALGAWAQAGAAQAGAMTEASAGPPLASAPPAGGSSGAPGAASEGGAPARPSRPPASSAEACAQGNARYQAHDLAAATALYRRAIELDPNDAVAHYLLGEAALAGGDIAAAEGEWSRAAALTGERDLPLRARILFCLADLKERQWKWNDATAAWQAYADLGDRYPDAGGVYPASARARMQAIAAMLQQDRAYEIVRRRIAQARDGGVSTDTSK